jgi:hypothetical protein
MNARGLTSCGLLFALFAVAAPPAITKKAEATPKSTPAEAPKDSNRRPTALLFGKEITAAPGDALNGQILGALFERYAQENKLRVTDKEVEAYRQHCARRDMEERKKLEEAIWALEKDLLSPSLQPLERAEKKKELAAKQASLESDRKEERETNEMRKKHPAMMQAADRQMAEDFVLPWKINHSLFQKYGGRVIFQQFGPEPLDAYRKFLEAREKQGDFKILDEAARKQFWKFFVDENMHSFFD